MTDPVIVVGAGPTGLALAAELALQGVPCRLLEKRAEVPNITRAFGVNARTLELLEARGLADQVLDRAQRVPSAQLNNGVYIDFDRLPGKYNFMAVVPQSGTEHVLEERCRELGVSIERDAEVTGIRQHAGGVEVQLGSRVERASYVVGCDGAHSAVRDAIGTEFAGDRYDVHLTLADVRLTDPPGKVLFSTFNHVGVNLLIPFGDGYHRAISFRHGAAPDGDLSLEEVGDTIRAITGTDFGLTDARWMTRFASERKQARYYRTGRVFLAGDAAHVHSPAGAQGMNTGIGDAMNLGWKLAAKVHGSAPAWLLDSYQQERHPVGQDVLRITDRMFRLVMVRSKLLQNTFRIGMRGVLSIAPIRAQVRSFLAGYRISYPPRGDRAHKLAGRSAPDITVGGKRLYDALQAGRFVLVDTTEFGAAAAVPTGERVITLAGAAARHPAVLLVRPDAYIAWASQETDPGRLRAATRAALADWCPAALE